MPEPFELLHPAPVRIGRSTQAPGMWLGGQQLAVPDSRERLGFGKPYQDVAAGQLVQYNDRHLLPVQYWQLYRTSPDVRACVDSIVRRIATWNWNLEVLHDPRDTAEYKRLRDKADAAQKWLQVPNANGETWQEVQTRTVTDLLLYDAGACELNMEGGKLLELVPWLGSEWIPVYNEKNALLYYVQEKEDLANSGAKLPPERLLYFSLFPNNRGPLGLPILDTLVNECVTVLLASEHAMMALDADEIPPGLLVLGGVAGAAAERARADLQQMRGRDHRLRVVSSPQPGGVKAEWVELRHTPKDLQLIEVVDQMRRAIWRVFGVMPVELGVADGMPRASATVQVDVASSHLITPILELLEARLNAQVVPLLVGEDADSIRFHFDRTQPLTPQQRLQLAQAQDLQVRRGIITVNEARAERNRLPLVGGDVAIVDTNEGPVPLAQVALGTQPEPKPPEDEDDTPPPAGPSSGGPTGGDRGPTGGDRGPTGGAQGSAGVKVEATPQSQPRGLSGADRRALGDLSEQVQQTLRDKARDHNQEVVDRGMADWRKTTADTLAEVFKRGVGAYNENPESVRPSVGSADQWAYARVNSFLRALLTDKFRRKPHDTDLLPEQHPESTKGQERAVVARLPDLPLAPLDASWAWEGGEQQKVLGDPPSWQRYGRAHLWRDPERAGQLEGYKFPVARMVEGELQLVFRGAAAVVGALKQDGKHESLEGVTVDEQRAVYQRVRSIYEAFGQQPPVIDRLEGERSAPCRLVGETVEACVQRKIPELIEDEGMPREQAVAVAYSLCEQACSDQRVEAKYSHINFTPPKGVVDELDKGLRWHEEGHSGDGLRPATVAWARRMVNGEDISPEKVRKMRAWLARHEVDKDGEGFYPDQPGFPSPGRVAWALWGGDPAVPWSEKLVRQLDAADEDSSQRIQAMIDHQRHRLSSLAVREDWLPSAWPSASSFRGYRTLALNSLADVVMDYGASVGALYAQTSSDLQAQLAAGYGGDSTISAAESAALKERMLRTVGQLGSAWSSVTRNLYRKAARVGNDAATDFAGGPTGHDWRTQADAYHQQAMAWLDEPAGLVGTLRSLVVRTVDQLTLPSQRTAAPPAVAACGCASVQVRDRIDNLSPDSDPADAVGTLELSLAGAAHRIDNWSGKLVGLSNAVLVDALNATVSQQAGQPVQWMAEWVNAGGRSCPICVQEGSQPVRPIGQFSRRPGEDTYCVGNCRCVLVFWTQAEVAGGAYVSLSALSPTA